MGTYTGPHQPHAVNSVGTGSSYLLLCYQHPQAPTQGRNDEQAFVFAAAGSLDMVYGIFGVGRWTSYTSGATSLGDIVKFKKWQGWHTCLGVSELPWELSLCVREEGGPGGLLYSVFCEGTLIYHVIYGRRSVLYTRKQRPS